MQQEQSVRTIPAQLFALALPIIGINVLAVLMLAVDAALCGRLPEKATALAALAFGVQIIYLLMVAMLGLIVGTVGLVARSYGAGDHARVNHLVVQSTQLTVLVGITVGVLGAVFARWIFVALGASDAVADMGTRYLRPLMIGTPAFYLTLLYAGIYRGVGNTRIPFICAVVANVINAVLNYALVLGHLGAPHLDVLGSAIGTICAQVVNLAILVVTLRAGGIKGLRLPLTFQPIDRGLARDLFRIGWPAAADMLVLNLSFVAALKMLAYVDELTVAAHGVGMRVQGLAFVPGIGIAQAAGAMIGQALGAGDVPRAKANVRAAILLCMAIMISLAIPIVFAARPLAEIFDIPAGSRLEDFSAEWMRILGLTMVPSAFVMAMMGLYQGSGATRTSLAINLVSTLAMQVPLAWILAFPAGLGATGVWLSFPVNGLVKAVWMWRGYRTDRWAVVGKRV